MILQIDRGVNKWMKHLIFVDTKAELDYMKVNLPGVVGVISSWENVLTKDDQFILATSSADVGITIPDVDIVVTKTFRYTIGPKGKGFYEMNQELITQRSGRTGRTNNGYVYLCKPHKDTKVNPFSSSIRCSDLMIKMVENGVKAEKWLLEKLFLKNFYVAPSIEQLSKSYLDVRLSYFKNEHYSGQMLKFVNDAFIDSYQNGTVDEFEMCFQMFVSCFLTGEPMADGPEKYKSKGLKGNQSLYFWSIDWEPCFSTKFFEKLTKEVSPTEPSAYFEEWKLRQFYCYC